MKELLKSLFWGCIISSLMSSCNAEFAFTFKGGIDPTFFTAQPNIYAVTNPDCVLSDIGKDRKFSQLFHNPGYGISVEIAYSGCGHGEVFGEFSYRHHNNLNKPFMVVIADSTVTVSNKLGDLNIYGGFLGVRYFFEPCCWQRVSFFVGAKLGMNHYNEVKTLPLTLQNGAGVTVTKNSSWFNANNTIAGGLQAGFDIVLQGQFSLFCNAEIVAGYALRSKAIIDLTSQTDIPIRTLMRQMRGTLFSFPVNIGLRYYFG